MNKKNRFQVWPKIIFHWKGKHNTTFSLIYKLIRLQREEKIEF